MNPIQKINQNHKISIVLLPRYRPEKKFIKCIKSLSKIDYPNYEFIIILWNREDNARFNYYSFLRNLGINTKNINIYSSNKNLGYTRGNNIGAKYASGEYLLIINPDVEVNPDFLIKLIQSHNYLVDRYKTDKLIIGPRICNRNGIIEYSRRSLNFLGFSNMDISKTTKLLKTKIISGCAFLIKKQYYDSLKGFDESYFLYHDDIEFSIRASHENMSLFIDNSIPLWHLKSDKEYLLGSFKYYWHERNRIKFTLEFARNDRKFRIFIVQMLMEPFQIFFALKQGFLRERLRILKYIIQNLRRMLKKRSEGPYDFEKDYSMKGILNEVNLDSLTFKVIQFYTKILFYLYTSGEH